MKILNRSSLITFLQGSVMGIVEVIPGVSGSTLALIMGMYDKFIGFLHDFSDFTKHFMAFVTGKSSLKKLKSEFFEINFAFGIPLVLGMLFAIGSFSHVMDYLLHNFPQYTYAFFFGLILASIRVPFFQIPKRTADIWMWFVFTSIFFFVVLGLDPAKESADPTYLVSFLSGFFAICAMVLPGISGSFVLLLLGMYDFVIDLIKNATSLNLSTYEALSLLSVLFGIITGFLLFVRVIKYALKKYPGQLMASLAGLMVASLRILWPFLASLEDPSLKTSPFGVPYSESALILAITGITVLAVLLLNSRIKSERFEI